MKFDRDGNGHLYVEWQQAHGHKRAWIQYKGDERVWASTGRYLNVVRCDGPGRPGGNPTDFPVFESKLSDEQLLRAFVYSVCSITGCELPGESNANND